MDPLTAITALTVGFGGPFTALWLARRWAHPESTARRRARRAPMSSTDRLVDGVVARIDGLARDVVGTALAPLSGRPCLAWTIELRSRASADADVMHLVSPDWDLLTRSRGGVQFLVEDGRGVVAVDPEEAVLALGLPIRYARGVRAEPPAEVRAALDARIDGPLPRSYRAVERVLAPDASVTVVGLARLGARELGEGGYRGSDDRWTLSGAPDHPVIVAA